MRFYLSEITWFLLRICIDLFIFCLFDQRKRMMMEAPPLVAVTRTSEFFLYTLHVSISFCDCILHRELYMLICERVFDFYTINFDSRSACCLICAVWTRYYTVVFSHYALLSSIWVTIWPNAVNMRIMWIVKWKLAVLVLRLPDPRFMIHFWTIFSKCPFWILI